MSYPSVQVTQEEFVLPQWRQKLGYVVIALQMVFCALPFYGEGVLRIFGLDRSKLFLMMKEKKWIFLGASFMLGSLLRGQLSNSGAFEIYQDGRLLFSKLETGYLPTIQKLQVILDDLLNQARR